jgi:hypothetical protein
MGVLAGRLRRALGAKPTLVVDLPRIGRGTEIQGITAADAVTMRTSVGVIELPISALAAGDRANLALAVAGDDGIDCAAVFLALAGDPRAEAWLQQADATGKLRCDLGLAR